jgi:phosphate starvation-inducible PhoH-like protein
VHPGVRDEGKKPTMRRLEIPPEVTRPVMGPLNEHLRLLEKSLRVRIYTRGNHLYIEGPPGNVARTERVIRQLSAMSLEGQPVQADDVVTLIRVTEEEPDVDLAQFYETYQIRASPKRSVYPKSRNQRLYVEAMRNYDFVFAIGPAGTGKTYMAVAMALECLSNRQVSRLILTRPAVEAGERLGFLPGTMIEKVHPYLRPLFDALYDLMDIDRVDALHQKGIIEIAPLAFMRGRTLNDAFIILDEAQNTTSEQMKMFLTRIGFNSKVVVTGDITQVDLPPGQVSGLREAITVLRGIEGLKFVFFDTGDVVRHPLVRKIVEAYERYEGRRSVGPAAGGDGPTDAP